MFAFAFYDISTFYVAGLTAFEARDPTASNPFDKTFPVSFNPQPSPLDAPTNTAPAVILFF